LSTLVHEAYTVADLRLEILQLVEAIFVLLFEILETANLQEFLFTYYDVSIFIVCGT
jgi:hypothetical protein